jgi:hypothetical protein
MSEHVTAALSVLTLVLLTSVPATAAEKPLFMASCRLDLGADVGQNFGTLFEVQDAQGCTVLGAGFPGVYNTHVRNERHALQFYARPPQDRPPWQRATLDKPVATLGGCYLYDQDGRLCAYDLAWDEALKQWQPDPQLAPHRAIGGDGVMRVGDGLLSYGGGVVKYNDQLILPATPDVQTSRYYYAKGHLCFYGTKPGTGDGRTSLYACPWTPADGQPVDLSRAKILQLTFTGETPFSWGQLGGQIVTCANTGGFYMFDGEWHVLRQPDKKVSYQIYTMVNVGDKLLMGQYPTGHLFEYDGSEITHLKDWPPVMPGVSTGARECQSSVIYRGDLYVGVWPWAEVWRYDRDAQQWTFATRCFTQPPITDKFTHPYEEDIVAYNAAHGTNIVMNDWGQRATSLTVVGGDLYVGTSAKGPFPKNDKLAFLTDEVFAEYGRVVKLTLPGNLSVNLPHAKAPTELRFVLTRSAMSLYRDGKLLAEQKLDPKFTAQIKPACIAWREGVFGLLKGKLDQTKASTPTKP